MNKLTVFTPTYNRAYIIKNLYDSLLKQTCTDFEWIVIDDGSTDETRELFAEILSSDHPFPIRYVYKNNEGKQRAINDAVKIIMSEYIIIVDSDDILTEDAVEKVVKWINDPDIDENYAGVSGVKGDLNGQPLRGIPAFEGNYIDCKNTDRSKYNLYADMAEVYKTDILRKYPFDVWTNETFLPEALVWDAIAADGYKLRWYKDVIYLCDYQPDGLTKGSWNLLKKNPMGYARLFDHNADLSTNLKDKLRYVWQMDSCLILAGETGYLKKCRNKVMGIVLLPAGYLLAERRKRQFKKYIQ